MEQRQVNNSVRVSQVDTIDEQVLVFKVIVAKKAKVEDFGNYDFDLPPLSDLTNSTGFNQAKIKLDQIVISPVSDIVAGVATNNSRPIWTDRLTLAAFNTGEAVATVILNLSLPSRQTTLSTNNPNNAVLSKNTTMYKYQELIPCFWEWRGNYQGIQTTNNGPPPVANGNSYAIRHQPNNNGVLCGNPFGSNIKFSFKEPYDALDAQPIYLADVANGANPREDITDICMQFTITMIPNK